MDSRAWLTGRQRSRVPCLLRSPEPGLAGRRQRCSQLHGHGGHGSLFPGRGRLRAHESNERADLLGTRADFSTLALLTPGADHPLWRGLPVPSRTWFAGFLALARGCQQHPPIVTTEPLSCWVLLVETRHPEARRGAWTLGFEKGRREERGLSLSPPSPAAGPVSR